MSAATLEPRSGLSCGCDSHRKAKRPVTVACKRDGRHETTLLPDEGKCRGVVYFPCGAAMDACRCACHKPPPSGGATSEPRVCVRCTKPILAIEGCTRTGEGWAHLKCRGPISGGAVGDIEERRAEYEWDGAPRGVCVVCGMFYEENVSHAGKDAPDSRPKHRFKTAPSGAAVDDGATPRTHEENVAWLDALRRRERAYGPLLAACKAFLYAHPSDRVGHWPCDCWDKLRDAIRQAQEGGA
jgi:hypothetical protein